MIREFDSRDALDELKEMLAWEDHPQLEEPAVVRLLLGCACKDDAGAVPGTDDWVPTYDLDAAAAEGWRRKAAKVAGDYNFSDQGSSLSRGQVIDACLKMATEYGKKISPSTRMFAYVDENALRDAFEEDIRAGFRVFEGTWFVP